jgi:intracellular sulfur oxidation DsrE/DsrF family protein
MNRITSTAVLLGALVCGNSWADTKVVYHLSDGLAQAAKAMVNIRYHLRADPKTKIVVVGHGEGVDFLLEGAKTPSGALFAGAVGDLANMGVEFLACDNTLTDRNIAKDRLAMEARVVPSGVAEVARLQAKEGFVYLKP